MATTLSDIARAAGVDRSTVCRVLRGQGRTSAETEDRIRRLAREMHYTPNPIARSLILGRSSFVGVVADYTISPAYAKLVDPIEQGLRANGLTMLLVHSPDTPEGEEMVVRQLMSYNIAGLIVIRTSVSPETDIYQRFIDSGGKLVIVNKVTDRFAVPQVGTSDYMPSRLAAAHLISLGHRRIAHLSINSRTLSAQARDRGFRDALVDAGLEVDEALIIPTEMSHEAGRDSALRLLRMGNPPTGIVTRYDAVAMGACDACFSEGLSVPGDVSVTGVADVWNPRILRVALTTIGHPYREIASRGVQMMIDLLRGVDVKPETIVIGSELIVRESTAPPRAVLPGPSGDPKGRR
jgi:LacI family transcriptional regulator